jgi:membrane fusion protein (multidrug efflux system)
MSRKRLFVALGLLLVLVGGVVVMKQMRSGPGAQALAADSTGVAPDSAALAGNTDAKDKKDKKGKKDEEEKDKPVPVELGQARTRDIPSFFHATGSLEAKRQVQLVSKAGGQVVRLSVEEGNFVRKGQVLLEIDHEEEALLAEQTKVKAETAKREFERAQGMVEKGLGSDRDFEEKRELAEVADLEHNLATVRLDNKIVRAPYAGQITVRHVELGQTVNPGDVLVDIADVSPLEVRIFLPEKIVTRLQPGQRVEIRSDVDPDTPFAGTVDRIAPSVDPATSTVKVTLQVDNPAETARVGSFVRARITTDVAQDVVAVPKRALVPEAGVNYLFVAEADSVRKVPVTTGYADDNFIEITKGIAIGEQVVTVGQGGLRQGTKIKDLAGTNNASGKETEKSTTGDTLADNNKGN